MSHHLEPLANVARHCAGVPTVGAKLVVLLVDGVTVTGDFTPAQLASLLGTIPPESDLNPEQRAIIDVCQDSRNALTAKEILTDAGIAVNSRTRGVVTGLADFGLLDRCNPGFKISALGRTA